MKKKLSYALAGLGIVSIHANQYHDYFVANYNQFGGNKTVAEAWYEHIQKKPHSVLTNKGYVDLLSSTGKFQKIIELMPKIEAQFKDDPDMQLIFVTSLQKIGKKKEADNKLITLSQQFKTHPELTFHAAETLVQRKELQNALALIDNYLNNSSRRPNNFIFYFLKGQIYLRMKDFKQARVQLQNCLEAHPRFPQGWLLKAMIEEEAGQLDHAIKGYGSYLELTGPNPQIQRHLIGLVLRKESTQKNKRIIVVNRSCFEKALSLFEKKEFKLALTQIDSCLSDNDKDMHSRLLKVQILTAMKADNDVIKTLLSWIAQDPKNLIWMQTLHLLPRTGTPMEKVVNAFTVLYTKYPQHEAITLYLADLHTRAGNNEKAIIFHRQSLKQIKQQDIRTRVLFQIAALQYESEQYNNMLSTIAELQQEQPSFAPAINLQAYYYATHGDDLAKAEELFEQAYKLDKGNPHFLDTKAVILYKQKKYDLALKLLEPLSEKIKEDSSIYIHLAKTYEKVNKHEKALAAIDHAKQYAQSGYERKATAILSYKWRKSASA